MFYSKNKKYFGYIHNSPKQAEYLRICLGGVPNLVKIFFSNFCRTTNIDWKNLEQIFQIHVCYEGINVILIG